MIAVQDLAVGQNGTTAEVTDFAPATAGEPPT